MTQAIVYQAGINGSVVFHQFQNNPFQKEQYYFFILGHHTPHLVAPLYLCPMPKKKKKHTMKYQPIRILLHKYQAFWGFLCAIFARQHSRPLLAAY